MNLFRFPALTSQVALGTEDSATCSAGATTAKPTRLEMGKECALSKCLNSGPSMSENSPFWPSCRLTKHYHGSQSCGITSPHTWQSQRMVSKLKFNQSQEA